MSLERDEIAAAVAREGRVARVVVARVEGSAPREVGTAMLVWTGGQSGTIGGGALEWEAAARARASLAAGQERVDRLALGPGLGQCCGGRVTLLTELWDAVRLEALGAVHMRLLPGVAALDPPLALRRALSAARSEGAILPPGIRGGWWAEPVASPSVPLWIWGGGHVGRAIASVVAPLPQIMPTLLDTALERLPHPLPAGVLARTASDLPGLVAHAPRDAHHLVLTYSHALDLELCHRLLLRGFASLGLIGSDTKWSRFRTRLGQLGHSAAAICSIECPIGDPALGKHPQAIAVSVAAALLKRMAAPVAEADARDGAA